MNLELGEPNAKQKEFFKATARYVMYGGARGGGKSWAVQRKAILLALAHPGIDILIIRRTFPELRENHIVPLQKLLWNVSGVKYNSDARTFLFDGGSRIRFGYCDTEADTLQYQGQNIEIIFLDEATQLTEFQFDSFKAANRSAKKGMPVRMYLTCNPGGVGHEWVKRLFVDRLYKANENADDYVFIPAKVYDNTVLMENDKDYVRMLETLPEARRLAWLHGDWNVFEGKYFTEFSPDLHVIEPFVIPKHWRVYRTLDYGLDMLACYWIAVDDQMNGYVFRECYKPDLIVYDAARQILVNTDEPVTMTLAPPDMWNRRQETGKSVADLFMTYGIPMVRTSNNREAGWMAVHEWLRPKTGEDGKPTAQLKIFKNCVNLIRTLPQLRHDEKRVNDVAREPHELTHAPDALRGFCVYWTMKAKDETDRADSMTSYTDFLSYGV